MSRSSRLRRALWQEPHKTPGTYAREGRAVWAGQVGHDATLGHSQPAPSRTAGRPRTKPSGDSPGDNREPERAQVRVPPARPAARPQDSPSCAPPGPRLLTRQQAAEYLNLSLDMIDRLTQQSELPRVQLTLGDRTVRKVLFDRADLDRLVELSRVV